MLLRLRSFCMTPSMSLPSSLHAVPLPETHYRNEVGACASLLDRKLLQGKLLIISYPCKPLQYLQQPCVHSRKKKKKNSKLDLLSCCISGSLVICFESFPEPVQVACPHLKTFPGKNFVNLLSIFT